MSRFPSRGLFIAGTDTDVGKTYVGCLIAQELVARQHRVGVYKPVASGTGTPPTDYERLAAAAGVTSLEKVCPQKFVAPLAPHLAARAEDKDVDQRLLVDGLCRWRDDCDVVIVEGVGGLMSPVADDTYCVDLAAAFGYPLIIVVPNRLGAINQALQSLVTAATYGEGLSIAGIIINDVSEGLDQCATSNPAELAARCTPPVLAHVRYNQQTNSNVDWWQLTR